MNTLSDFIARNVVAIVDEFETYARSCGVGTELLSSEDLRDHGQVLLEAAAQDMRTEQSAANQHAKSIGRYSREEFSEVKRTSHLHAEHRFSQGFSLPQMQSESRALRASVIRLWQAQLPTAVDVRQLDELIRFGEAIDEALTEAIGWYTAQLEKSRALLIAVLAHDIRGPLNAARMSADYLMNAEPLNDKQLRASARIASSTKRIAGYVGELLDFTQTLLGDGLPISKAEVDLVTLGKEVAGELEAAHPGAFVEFEAPESVTSSNWDGARLAQLLTNLGTNAIIHGLRSEPIKITVRQAPEVVWIDVQNAGAPIPSDRLPTLFQPLMQGRAKERVNAGSSGLSLGLYIVKQIAEAHGGNVRVVSDKKRGTTFTVTLPRSDAFLKLVAPSA